MAAMGLTSLPVHTTTSLPVGSVVAAALVMTAVRLKMNLLHVSKTNNKKQWNKTFEETIFFCFCLKHLKNVFPHVNIL